MSKIEAFGEEIYKWLSQFATTYRNELPADPNIKVADLYIKIGGYYDNFATRFIYPLKIYKQNTTSHREVIEVADNISKAIGDGGLLIRGNGVTIVIYKGSPFYQDMQDEDNTIRAGYVNLEISIY